MSADPIFMRCRSPHQGHWVVPLISTESLAVTPWLSRGCELSGDTWVITHIPTGHKVRSDVPLTQAQVRSDVPLTQAQALVFLAKLTALAVDWDSIRPNDPATAQWRDTVREIENEILQA